MWTSGVQRGSTIEFGDFLGHIVPIPGRDTYCPDAIRGSRYKDVKMRRPSFLKLNGLHSGGAGKDGGRHIVSGNCDRHHSADLGA